MGASSSVLDENKHKFIKEWVQTELTNFAPVYKKQYSLAFLSHVHDELVQRKQEHTQLLKQRDSPEEAEVIYQESVLCFYDNKKWKERFVVVRANYSLECHESYETFMKGTPSLYKLPTTGGTILTAEEKYMEVVDRCFPDTDNVKEDFAPPMVGMPGQFPVYLRLPYQRDHYFCFLQEAKHAKFISVLSDCIRHQNQDFLKKKMYVVKAFIKAIQLYRQDKGLYEPWDMLIGNDVQVLANLAMEELLPCLEKDMFPRLKAKKTERKRMWFATIEAAYNLVQETLTEGMVALNNECLETTKQQSALMRSDMDQIMGSRAFLENKLRATVAELATEYCKQHIAPRLPAVLEEMMGPISLGFEEARQISERMIENLCRKYQEGITGEELQQALGEMSKPDLKSCYEKVSCLRDQIKEFNYPNCRGLEHSTQIDIQQLVDNVAYTFGLLLNSSSQDSINLVDTMVKAKHRVLKQYDYDSSTQRKKIFQNALLSITLPSVRAFLAPTFQKDLPDFQQYIFDDYANFINVESVYEDILEQILHEDISKVVKEAASMKKYNLFMESRYRMSLSTPPGSPDYTNSLKKVSDPLPSSSLLSHGLKKTGEDQVEAEKMVEHEIILPKLEEAHVHAQPEIVKVSAGEDRIDAKEMVEQEVTTAEQEDEPQPEIVKVPVGENRVEAEKMVEQEVITPKQENAHVHAQPEIVKVSAGGDRIEADKVVEQEVMTAKQEYDPQPEIVKVSAGGDRIEAEKVVEQEVMTAKQEDDPQPEIFKGSAGKDRIEAEKTVEQEVMTAKQEDDQVHAQPEIVKVPVGENRVEAEKMVEQEVITPKQENTHVHAQPEIVKVSAGGDRIEAEKVVEQEVMTAKQEYQPQPEIVKVSAGKDRIEPEKMQEVMTAKQEDDPQPAIVKGSAGKDRIEAEKMQEVMTAKQEDDPQPEIVKGSAGKDRIEAEKMVEQEVMTAKQEDDQVHAQPEIVKVPVGENRVEAEKMVEQEVITPKQENAHVHAQPEIVKVSAGEDRIEAEKMVEQEVMTAKQEDDQVHPQQEIVEVSASEYPVETKKVEEQEIITAKHEEARVHAQPEIFKVPIGEGPVKAEKVVEPDMTEVQAHAQPDVIKVSTLVKGDEHKVEENEVPPGMFTVVEELLVATQSLEKKTYSDPPDIVAITTETLVDPFFLSNTELVETIPKLMESRASEMLVQASPPVGDRGSMDQKPQREDLKFVSAESETKSAVQQTAPELPCSSVQPLDEEQTLNASGDTKVIVYDLTSVGAPAYEDRTQDGNGMQDFSDNSSWTTEEEGDSIDDDDVTMETTKALTTPEDTLILKSETEISDVNMNVTNNSTERRSDEARPLDCIKEIRELVVEVIEVEEVIQHCPKH